MRCGLLRGVVLHGRWARKIKLDKYAAVCYGMRYEEAQKHGDAHRTGQTDSGAGRERTPYLDRDGDPLARHGVERAQDVMMKVRDRKEYMKKYNEIHRDEKNRKRREYRLTHLEYERERHKKYRQEHLKEHREERREYRKLYLDRVREQSREYRMKYPERCKANKLAKKIPLSPFCEICGEIATTRHHADYSKPMEVIHLCAACHRKLHMGRGG